MEKVLLQLHLQQHKGTERVFICYPFNTSINKIVQSLPGARYSGSCKKWHIPVVKEIVRLLVDKVKDTATVDTSLLKEQLLAKKQVAAIVASQANKPNIASLSVENDEAFKLFIQTLVLKAYSKSTIRTYKSEFTSFIQILGNKAASDISAERLKDYLQYCHETLGLKENTLHSRMNALKFYYEQVLHKEKFFWEIPRPKKPLILPKVINETELGRLFNAVSYLKHKAILFTAYSAGLRVSEVINLQWKHIDLAVGRY